MMIEVELPLTVAGYEPVMNPEADADEAAMLANASTATAAMQMCLTRLNFSLPTYVVCIIGKFSRLFLECVSQALQLSPVHTTPMW